MNSIANTAVDVSRYYVTPGWVAKFYGVSKLQVYRAIQAGRLNAVRIRGGSLVLDQRLLPPQFPR